MTEIVSFTAPHPQISEKAWTDLAIRTAIVLGWRIHHSRPARTKSGGWATALAGHKGLPDLILAHPKHGVLFIELKSWRGRLEEDQERWRDVLLASGARWYCFKPKDYQTLVALLNGSA